tara:strand:- start:226 stop:396 length:171 start_codon:yes stop_codon:yes gene_type:complete
MKNFKHYPIAIAIVLSTVIYVCANRYDFKMNIDPQTEGLNIRVLDKWTGKVHRSIK